MLTAMTGMIDDMQPDAEKMYAAASLGFSTATDLADWLVLHAKLPFREAHHATGRIVKAAEKAGVDLAHLPLAVALILTVKLVKWAKRWND